MIPYPTLFWFAALLSAIWNGWTFVNYSIAYSFHPMAAMGDSLRVVKEAALLAPIPIAVTLFLLWLWRRPLANRAYITGIAFIVAATLLPWLPRIEGDYRQTYWLGETRHEIPWYFAPSSGSPEPGGELFWVSVSFPELEPRYKTKDKLIAVGKAVDFENSNGGSAPREPCIEHQTYTRCEWQHGEFVYMISTHPELFPSDVSGFMAAVTELLNGFEVREPG